MKKLFEIVSVIILITTLAIVGANVISNFLADLTISYIFGVK